MDAGWIHAGRYDIRLDRVAMVKRRRDGSVTVYLCELVKARLKPDEAEQFLPGWEHFLGLTEGDGGGGGGGVESSGRIVDLDDDREAEGGGRRRN